MTETLIGGQCDGLEILQTDSRHMYAGVAGIGYFNVYLRREDGRLHFSHREYPPPPIVYRMVSTCSANSITIVNDTQK